MSQAPRYEDFSLGFTADPADPRQFRVSIRQAPCPGPDGTLRIPFSPEEASARLTRLERQVTRRLPGRHVEALNPQVSDSKPDEFGRELFDELFRGSVERSFLESRERVQHLPGTGLRLRLVIDPESPGGALLASIPWELLYRHATREYLSRILWTPVVRFLVTGRAPGPARLTDELRILLVSSNPAGSTPLNLGAEASELESAWSRRGARVHRLEEPSIQRNDLHRALRRIDPHVLHFMGHGAFEERSGEAGLVLEGESGGAEVYTASVLQQNIRACPSLRFVCLNACTTGRLPRRRGQDPFSGLASSLVMAGLPAVVAMQFPISDQAALAFSSGLYQSLAAGDPVDAAATEGRMAVFTQDPTSWEWATPALYLSVPDGQLFEAPGDRDEHRPDPPAPDPPPDRQSTFVAERNRSVVMGRNVSVGTMNVGSDHRSERRGER